MNDPQKTTGQIPYPMPGPCVCGHLWSVHALVKGKPSPQRGACSSWGYRPKCGCKRYEAVSDGVA